MSDPFKLGMNANLYYNTTGVGGSGSWLEVDNCTDVTLNLESAEADVSTRGNNGWRATTPTLRDASIEFEQIWDPGNAAFTAFKNSYINGTTIGVECFDGDRTTTGTQGLRADCRVTTFTRTEPLEEAMKVSVTVKPTYSATAPDWVTIT